MRGLTIRAGLIGVFCALTACADIAGIGGPQAQITQLALYDGTVVVAAPNGYCIETRASRAAEGFAVLAACSAIAGSQDRTGRRGFVTVQVGPAGSAFAAGEADALESLLGTAAGRALLSQTGAADDITVRATDQVADAVTVRFLDAAAPPVPGLQNTEWRGFFALDTRLTTVAVRGLAEAPLGTDDGGRLLVDVIRVMQVRNAPTPTTPDT